MTSHDKHVIGRVLCRAATRSASSLASLQCAVMSDIPKLLLESLNPHTRKQAEQALDAYSRQPAFVVHLLQLVLATSNNAAVRLAASVYLKNRVKLGWLDDVRQSSFILYVVSDRLSRTSFLSLPLTRRPSSLNLYPQ